jgi:hypothetical protein
LTVTDAERMFPGEAAVNTSPAGCAFATAGMPASMAEAEMSLRRLNIEERSRALHLPSATGAAQNKQDLQQNLQTEYRPEPKLEPTQHPS